MGNYTYNTVEITGDELSLKQFESIAFESVSEALFLHNLIHLPANCNTQEDIAKFNFKTFKNPKAIYFSVLTFKDENSLVYYFNSKNCEISFNAVAKEYSKLVFAHTFFNEGDSGFPTIIRYQNDGVEMFYNSQDNSRFNWGIPFFKLSYQYLEIYKFHYFSLLNQKAELLKTILFSKESLLYCDSFFQIFPRLAFLKSSRAFYERLYLNSNKIQLPEPEYLLDAQLFNMTKMGFWQKLKYIESYIVDSNLKKRFFKEIIDEIILNADADKPEKSLTDAIVFIYSNYDLPKLLYKICKKHINSRIRAIKEFKKNYDQYCAVVSDRKYFRPVYVESSFFITDLQYVNPWPEISDLMIKYEKEKMKIPNSTSEFDDNFYAALRQISSDKQNDNRNLVELFVKTLEELNIMENEYYENCPRLGFQVELNTSLSTGKLKELASELGIKKHIPDFNTDKLEDDDLPF
jgi:hypothetical protein